MTCEELQEFAELVQRMNDVGRVPNFAFWPDKTILYVGFVENMRFPPRVEVEGPFGASALEAARRGAELAEKGAWD